MIRESGSDSTGRPIGYTHLAVCDHPECGEEIDRGLSYACGDMHGETEYGCELYFCEEHMIHTDVGEARCVPLCEKCVQEVEANDE